jgi:hypothetical protein
MQEARLHAAPGSARGSEKGATMTLTLTGAQVEAARRITMPVE